MTNEIREALESAAAVENDRINSMGLDRPRHVTNRDVRRAARLVQAFLEGVDEDMAVSELIAAIESTERELNL